MYLNLINKIKMKKLYSRFTFSLLILSIITFKISAQNVFDVNDKDSIFGATKPPVPAWGRINKWGHAVRLTNWGGTGTTTFKSYIFNQMPFRLKYPKSYQQGVNDGKLYPVYIFFHGAGESGTAYDNEYQMFWGGKTFRDFVDQGKFDGFLFYEQSTDGYHSSYFPTIVSLMDSLVKYCKVDPFRIIVDGLSSGGQGTWDFLGADPKYIAGALPISAARNEYIPNIPKYIHIPIWLFNGGLDNNPAPEQAQYLVDTITHAGGYIKHTFYPTLGHGVWTNAWADTGFVPFMNWVYKSNPLVYFQKTNFCTGQTVTARLGVTAGFFAYQWMKDGVVIPGATSNEITVTQLGTYSARIQRTSGAPWSDWSHSPAVLTTNVVAATPNIQVNGLRSIVLPAPDGSTTVPLMEATGASSYKWIRTSDNAVVGTQNIYNAPPGTYTATVTPPNACSSSPSVPFTVINANAANGPDPASSLTAIAASQTSIKLSWSKNPHPSISETAFEIYRGTTAGGPYTLDAIVPKDTINYLDQNLTSNTTYYYVVRAINNNAGSKPTNEATTATLVDNTPPTAPSNLVSSGSTQSSISLQWTASTDNVGVVSYDIYVNGKKSYTVNAPATSFTVYNLTHGATYNLQVKAEDAAGNVSTFSNQVTASAVANGLSYSLYLGTWSNLPNFNTLQPVATGAVSNVSLTPASPNTTNFGLLFQGYINIRKQGTYTFETSSDDGSRLYVGGIGYNPTGSSLVNNDGSHGTQSRTGNITLSPGLYPFAVAYFQGAGGSALQVFWTCTSAGISRSLIPDSAFKEAVTINGSAPAAPSNLVATASAYNKINLSWTDNSTNETGFEIYRATSASGPWNTIATTASAVTSYIDSTVAPSTAYFYKIRAINTFGQSAFDAIGVGTQYAYYPSATTLTALPNFASMTPTITGTLPNFTLTGLQTTQSTNYAVEFDSYIKINTAGTYTFSTTSDDGSALFINGTRVVNNDGAHGSTTKSGTIALGVGTFPITVTYFNGSGGGSLSASYSGPGVSNQQIPSSVLGKAFATATTPALPPAPKAPFALNASTLSNSAIKLIWSDTSNDASTFQIYRSVNDNSNYRLIATMTNPGGTNFNYTDSSLFDFVVYYYKVNAVAVGGTSPYSVEDSARTLLNNPVLTAIPSFTMRYGTKDTVNISATNPDGVALTISTVNLPAFAALTDNHDGTGRIIFSPATSDAGTYNNIIVNVNASNGGIAADTFNVIVNDNHPPVLNAISNVAFDEGTKDTVSMSATDQDGVTGLVWSSSNLPSFASIVNNNDGTAKLILAPTFISHGTYNVQITVTDPQGGASTKSFTLTINKKSPNEQYLVRMQYSAPMAAPWNNMTGTTLNNLINAVNGQSTPISVNFSPSNWWNTFNQGPTTNNNSGVYPDSVLKEYFYFAFNGGPATVTNTISGLRPGAKYNFKFYAGSVSPYVADAGTTVYTIGAQSASLYVQGNTQNTANINGVVADPSGNVVVTMSRANDGTPAGFLNAFEIDYVYDDSTAPAKPTNLTAALLPSGAIKLNWNDVAYNAQQYLVYRATDTTQPFTVLNPGTSDGNLSTFTDSSVAGHTTYYYKLKAVNNYGDLGFTDVVSVTTATKNPTVSAISDATVKVNTTGNIAFTATDDPGDAVTVTANLPSFATLQSLGNGSYNILITPSSNNIGNYQASVTATDSYGATTTDQFNIAIIESNVSSVFIHFGTDTSIAQQPWNNALGYPFAGSTVSNLKRADGSNSGITLTLLDQWSSPPNEYGMNTGDNSGIFPDVVLKTSLVETTTTGRRIKFSGLDQSKFYNVVFFSSADNGQKGTSTYTIGAQSVNLEAAYNTTKTVQINGLKPDGTGAITVTYQKDAASVYGYLNAIIIQSYDSSVVHVVSPNFLYVEPVHTSKTSLKLGWADRSNNETNVEVWRSTTLNGTFSKIATLAAGSTSYTDQNLTPNTQYFYSVRAVNASFQSDFSSVAWATTPSAIVLEHLTWHYPEGLRPWNNTGVNAQIGDVYGNLKDDQWNNTGYALNVVDGPFEGETNTGMVSGNNSYIFPDSVMLGAFYVQLGSEIAVLKFTGLDQSKVYRIGFEGSTNVNLDMTSYMTINGVTKYLNNYSNTSKVVYFNKVVPDENGEVLMTFGAKGQYGVLGALVLMSYTDYGNANMGGGGTGGNQAVIVNGLNGSQTAESIDDPSGLKHFIAYPNPFRDAFTVAFNNPDAGKKIDIEVYNINGQLVLHKEGGYAQAGANSYNVYMPQGTTPGMYMGVIKSDGKAIKVFKLIKAK